MSHYQAQPMGERGPRRSTVTLGQRIVGLVLLVPAVVLLVVQQVMPTLDTLWMSVSAPSGGGFGAAENFGQIPGEYIRALLTTAGLGLLIAAMGVGVGTLLGMLLQRASLGWRRAGLALLGAGLLTYGPGSISYALFYAGSEGIALLARWIIALLPLFVVIGALTAVLTRSAGLRLAVGAVAAVGGAALAMQSDLGIFASFNVPGGLIQRDASGWVAGPGVGAAMSVLLGLLLAVLGVLAAVLLLTSRPRLDLSADPPSEARAVVPGYAPGPGYAPRPPGASPGLGVLAVLASCAVVVVLVVLAWPWLSHIGVGADAVQGAGDEEAAAAWNAAGRRTLETVLTVLVTGGAAIGIGYLRPFGRHSLRVLLVVSPWFYVGLVPLMLSLFVQWRTEVTEPPFFGLSPPVLVVPLLFVLTYIADGARSARDAGHRIHVGATIALVVFAVGAVVVVRSQQLLWDILFLFADVSNSAVQTLEMMVSRTVGVVLPLGILTPPVLLVVGALVVAAAAAMVPGAQLVRGSRSPQHGQPYPPGQPYPQPQPGYSGYGGYPDPPPQQDVSWGPTPDDGRYGPGPPGP